MIKKPRRRIYYGWVIVGVVALAGVVQTGQFNPTIGVFIKPITDEFGWSRTTFVGAVSAGTVLGGVTAIFVGPLLDRHGPRWIVSAGFLLVGGAMTSMAFVNELWQFYISMIVGRIALQGAITLGITVTVAKWFVRQRGRAIALSGLGTRVGNGVSPLYAQGLVTAFGWRPATFTLGVVTWLVALVPTFLFLRRRPEDMGLRPDGDPPRTERGWEPEPAEAAAADQEVSYTLSQTARSRVFYLIMAVMMLSFFAGAGLNIHLLAYFNDQGLSPGTGALILTVWAAMGTLTAVPSGFMAERVSLRHGLGFTFLAVGLSVVWLSQVDSNADGYVWAVLYGLCWGPMSIFTQLLLPDYFGREAIGAIRGLAASVQMAANALGPLAAALAFDQTGGYGLIFAVFVGLYLLMAFILLFLIPPPEKPARLAAPMRS